jgi:hypothetical protein
MTVNFRKNPLVSLTIVSAHRSSDGILSHIQNVVSKFNLECKLAVQTYCKVNQ